MSTPLNSARTLLQAEASALAELATRLDGSFTKAVDLIAAHQGKVVLCGVGKSGLIGQKIAATLCSTGTPAIFLHAADAVHGDLGILQAGDPVILISRSGTTAELVRLIPVLRSFKSPIISIVGNTQSPLATQSDVVLDIGARLAGELGQSAAKYISLEFDTLNVLLAPFGDELLLALVGEPGTLTCEYRLATAGA